MFLDQHLTHWTSCVALANRRRHCPLCNSLWGSASSSLNSHKQIFKTRYLSYKPHKFSSKLTSNILQLLRPNSLSRRSTSSRYWSRCAVRSRSSRWTNRSTSKTTWILSAISQRTCNPFWKIRVLRLQTLDQISFHSKFRKITLNWYRWVRRWP